MIAAVPAIPLEGLAVGVDNLRHDVSLSPRFVEAARAQIMRLIVRHGELEGLVSAETPKKTQQGPNWMRKAAAAPVRNSTEKSDWKPLLAELHLAALNRAKKEEDIFLDLLALAETWDNGKPIRETMAADVPLSIDHFRYFASCIRAQEGSIGEIDHDTVAYHFHEPLGVVGQIVPWNFPLLMAAWKLGPALATGCTIVLKPAEQTPLTALLLGELIQAWIDTGAQCP